MKDTLCTNNELDINYNSALKPPAIARLYNIIIYNALIPPKFKPFSLIQNHNCNNKYKKSCT